MNTNGLCGNPDCSAFFDQTPVPHLDTETKRVVLLCRQCAVGQPKTSDRRYQPIPTPTERVAS